MSDFLTEHARLNVWCNPTQDNQLIFAGTRLSKISGALNTMKIFNRNIDLPVTNERYHCFYIGQLPPSMLNLLSNSPTWTYEKWYNVGESMNELKIFINLYNDKGINACRFESYYMYTNEKALIYIIKQNNKIPFDYINDTIYFRLYSNAFYQSTRSSSIDDVIYYEGKNVYSSNDIIDMQILYNTYNNKQGYVFAYKNGFLIDNINAINVQLGDNVEMIFDGSVKKVQKHKVKDLTTFNSILDSSYKYLLHNLDNDTETIDYQDDIDIYVEYNITVNRYLGLYFHRNEENSHRMVTHKDYSIPVENFENSANYLNSFISEDPIDFRELTIEIIVRESGYLRPLIYDNNRIFELYKLPSDLRLQAMTGLNSSCEIWRAENLENSDYTKLMRVFYNQIDLPLVKQAYGYNGISKYLADTPITTYSESSLQKADLPYGLRNNSTIYEYDIDGYLLNINTHISGDTYIANGPATKTIEAIKGLGSYSPNVVFGLDNIPLSSINDYRVYMCRNVNGNLDNIWSDITGSDFYTVVNDVLIWSGNISNQYLMVRFDNTFLTYELNVNTTNDLLYFTLSELENRGFGLQNFVLPIPLGELDIFLNGKILIRDLDYKVSFPKVYIINKEYLKQPANSTMQKIIVRYTGFANSDLSNDQIDDYGFIEHGMLSNNNRFDIRDDKVLNISVNGKLIDRSNVLFSELLEGSNLLHPLNGKPYQIKDIIVPMKDYINEDTYNFRNNSLAIDEMVSNYLTIKIPQPTRSNLNVIPNKYPVVSPFINFIIHSLVIGAINSNDLSLTMSDNDVLDICKSREYLLEYDPIREENKLNPNYVIVHPHNRDTTISLTQLQYSFLSKVIRLYGNDVITLAHVSPFITIVN